MTSLDSRYDCGGVSQEYGKNNNDLTMTSRPASRASVVMRGVKLFDSVGFIVAANDASTMSVATNWCINSRAKRPDLVCIMFAAQVKELGTPYSLY